MHYENLSLWLKTSRKLTINELKEDLRIDVAIIGGGITGLHTALLLEEKGIKAAVFEANEIGNGATGFTTAKVTIQHGLIYSQLLNQTDEETAKYYAEINKEALHNIKRIINDYNIQCDFVTTNSNVYASSKKSVDNLLREYTVAKTLGLDVEYEENISLPFKAYANLTLKNQGMFHPKKYINGLAETLINKKVQIYEHTRVTDIHNDDGYTLLTEQGYSINADKVIIATKYPILNKKKMLFAKLYVERSYVIACQMPNFRIDGYYINAEDKVRSLREYKNGDERLILIAGGNHEAGDCKNAEQSYLELIKFANELDDDTKVKFKWSTQDCMTMDRMPYIGRLSEDMPNVYIATGFNKWGMNQSMVAAIILSDTITKTNSVRGDIFSVERTLNVGAKKELMGHGTDIVSDYIKSAIPVEKKDFDEVKIGRGEIIKYKGEVLGVYKDEDSNVFTVVPKCPHMGCRLNFNQAEKTWDCPCHGSRFTYKGEIIESPAVKKLKERL